MNHSQKSAIYLVIAFLPLQVFAQEEPNLEYDLTYGISAVGLSGLYVGQEDEVFAVPLLVVTTGNWTFNLTEGVSYQVFDNGASRLSAGLSYAVPEDVPNTALYEGWTREAAVSANLNVQHDFGVFDVAANIATELTNEHGGTSGALSVGRGFVLGNVIVEGRYGAQYLDSASANYLYGVKSSESTAARSTYDVSDSWSAYTEVSLTVPLNEQTAMSGFLRHDNLSDAISRSPLVAENERTFVGLSIVRRF
ncbi:MAG: MipA/OmpV family protein [Pseudomonadota bacterium]